MKKMCVLATLTLMAACILGGCSSDSPTLIGPVADKAAEHFDIAGDVEEFPFTELGRWLTTPSGITHMWGFTFDVEFTGDLVGDGVFVQAGTWDATYTGVVSGKLAMENADVMGVTGSFRGAFTGKITNGWLEGSTVMQGTGGLDSYHAAFTLVGFLGGPYSYTGKMTVDEGN